MGATGPAYAGFPGYRLGLKKISGVTKITSVSTQLVLSGVKFDANYLIKLPAVKLPDTVRIAPGIETEIVSEVFTILSTVGL